MIRIESSIRRYSKKAVFFTKICYGNILPVTTGAPYKFEKVVLVSGIADPSLLEHYINSHYDLVTHFSFKDHHTYSLTDLTNICDAATQAGAVVVTTEKDVVKIDDSVFLKASVPLFYLPIEIEFLKNGKEFDEMVLNAARSYAS